MAKKRPKKGRRKKAKRRWSSRIVTLLSFILFFAVLSLIVSILLRWIIPQEADPVFGRNVIRVEVLNGCGEYGVAEGVTDWLREQGFDIVYFGNADSFEYKKSLLIDRSGRPEFVGEVATVLGCDNIERKFEGMLLLDVTVIVGKDWRELRLEETGEGRWESTVRNLRETIVEWLAL